MTESDDDWMLACMAQLPANNPKRHTITKLLLGVDEPKEQSPGDRPRRKEPPLWDIVNYWHERDRNLPESEQWMHSRHIGLGEPFCFKCHWLPPVMDGQGAESWKRAGKFLDRGHLITRYYGGLDLECNLVPVCKRCHAIMPDFKPGEEEAALSWIRQTETVDWAWQACTDKHNTDGARALRAYMMIFRNLMEKMEAGTK